MLEIAECACGDPLSASQVSARSTGFARQSPEWAARSTGVRHGGRRCAPPADRRLPIRVCPGCSCAAPARPFSGLRKRCGRHSGGALGRYRPARPRVPQHQVGIGARLHGALRGYGLNICAALVDVMRTNPFCVGRPAATLWCHTTLCGPRCRRYHQSRHRSAPAVPVRRRRSGRPGTARPPGRSDCAQQSCRHGPAGHVDRLRLANGARTPQPFSTRVTTVSVAAANSASSSTASPSTARICTSKSA